MARACEFTDDSGWLVFCPACGHGHKFDKGRWTLSGTLERPTFSPSMLVKCSSWQNIQQDQWMPIQGGTKGVHLRVPFAMLSEASARRNHDQSLRELASRGGLSAFEALCNLDGARLLSRPIRPDVEEEEDLSHRIQDWIKDHCPPSVCHSFVRDGRIQFLSDCTHKLANQTVDLPDIDSLRG